MFVYILLIVVGFIALIMGANWLVDGASALAKKYKVSDLAIGLTIVAFGTSAPELIVNSIASVDGHSDIVLGNIIGSNNFNLFIILGISGLVYPIAVQSSTAWREIPISLLITVAVFMVANEVFISSDLKIGRIEAVILLACFFGFLYYVSKKMKTEESETNADQIRSNSKIWALIIIGLAGLIIGGKLVVDNAVLVASGFGVSQKIIGLTIVAAGTSLPELVTSLIAAIKKNSDIAIGNVVGSNIFNFLLILPISALINPISYRTNFNADLYILAGGTLFLIVAMITGKKKKLDRWEAFILLVFYLAYTAYLVSKEL